MPRVDALVECPIHDSFRVQQVAGMFDMNVGAKGQAEFHVELPDLSEDWQVGAIVGPSGSGKTTIAKHAYGGQVTTGGKWPKDRAIVDAFPASLGIKQITKALTAVGFSSPPAWVKPFHVLSNGERFRADLARCLLTAGGVLVFDEFTSVVDRTVAKIGSAALAKAIRKHKIAEKFVAVSCHYDVLEWLEVDWWLDMASGRLERRRLRRPDIELEVRRVGTEVWPVFARHHYMTGNIHPRAMCFLGMIESRPAAFASVISYPHPVRPRWMFHRVVTLPDFQGVGVGAAISNYVAGLFLASGKPITYTTSHPAVCRFCVASPLWRCKRKPSRTSPPGRGPGRNTLSVRSTVNRLTMSFDFCGEPNRSDARDMGLSFAR